MDYPQRRKHPRIKTRAPVEIHVEGSENSFQCATSDLSIDGCYIETMFPFPVGTSVELKLRLEGTLLILATVVTSDPLVGNGLRFLKVLPDDLAELQAFVDAAVAAETEDAKKND